MQAVELLRENRFGPEGRDGVIVLNQPVNVIDPLGLAGIGPPPVPVPGGGADTGWKWNPNLQNSRGGSWGPTKPIKGRSQPSASWDPEGHWDVDDGLGNRQRCDDERL